MGWIELLRYQRYTKCMPYKGRNFNTQTFGKCFYFVLCMISRTIFTKHCPPTRVPKHHLYQWVAHTFKHSKEGEKIKHQEGSAHGFKLFWRKQKQKYRGMFETQKSRNKTSSGDIGLNIRTLASPKEGQDQVSWGVSVPCRHATPDADALWKPIFSNSVKVGNKSSQDKAHKLVS